MNKLIKYFNETYGKEYGNIEYPRNSIEMYGVYQIIKDLGLNDEKLNELLDKSILPKPKTLKEKEMYSECISELKGNQDLSKYATTDYVNTQLKEIATDVGIDETDTDGIFESYGSIMKAKVFYVDNVAKMKISKFKVGDYVITAGYYTPNDGGRAEYRITDTLNSDKYQETLANGLYATLISNDINPLQFGAIGDGTTDNAALLNDILSRYNKLTITGDFKINSSIILSDNMQLYGDAKHSLITPDNSDITVKINGDNVIIDNLNIYSVTEDYNIDTKCIEVIKGDNCIIKNCELYNVYHGIKLSPNDNNSIRNLKIENNNIHTVKSGIYFGNANEGITYSISNIYIGHNHIHNGVGEVDVSSLNNGIKTSRLTQNVVIEGNIIHDMKADGIDCYKSGDTLQITNNQIYNNGESAIEVKDGTKYDDTVWGYSKSCVISNNIFYGHKIDVVLNGTPHEANETVKQYKNIIVSSNVFKNGTTGLKITCSNVTVISNIFDSYSTAGIILYDSYGLNTDYKNIDISNNQFRNATIRVIGNNFYNHIHDNCLKIIDTTLAPIYNASPHTIIGDNIVTGSEIPYVKSDSNSIVRQADRFIMIPFNFSNVSDRQTVTQVVLPKMSRNLQLIGGYITTTTKSNTANTSCNIKADDINMMYLPSTTDIYENGKLPLRQSSTFTSYSDKNTIISITSNVNVEGYVMLYYAFS